MQNRRMVIISDISSKHEYFQEGFGHLIEIRILLPQVGSAEPQDMYKSGLLICYCMILWTPPVRIQKPRNQNPERRELLGAPNPHGGVVEGGVAEAAIGHAQAERTVVPGTAAQNPKRATYRTLRIVRRTY